MNKYKLVAVAAICSVLSCCSSGREGHLRHQGQVSRVSEAPDVISMRVVGPAAEEAADAVTRPATTEDAAAEAGSESVPTAAAAAAAAAAVAAAERDDRIALRSSRSRSQRPEQTITVTYSSLRWMFNSGLKPLRIVGSEGDLAYLSAPDNLVVVNVRTGRAGLVRAQNCRVVSAGPGRLILYDGSLHYAVSFTSAEAASFGRGLRSAAIPSVLVFVCAASAST